MIYVLKACKWVAMSTNVYVDIIKEDKILLYHTKSGVYKVSCNRSFIGLVKCFYSPEMLGVIQSDQLISNYSVDVEWALKNKVFIPINTIQKPIVLLPILNLQKDIGKVGKGSIDDRLAIIGSKHNFISSGIYIRISEINNRCDAECSKFRRAASKQYPCPTYSQCIDRISPEKLSHILSTLKNTCVSIVDIVCSSDYFSTYSKEDFLHILSKYDYKYRIHFFIDDIDFALSLLNLVQSIKVKLVAYVDKFSTEVKPEVAHLLDRMLYLNYGEATNKDNVNILPVYIGADKKSNNMRIRHIKEEGVFEQKVCFNDIFRNQKLNSNFFGIVDVDPRCNIRAYGSQYTIGNVTSTDFSWTDIVVNELKQNHSWRLTRDMTDCKDCPLRYMCPPISSYEISSNNTQICG